VLGYGIFHLLQINSGGAFALFAIVLAALLAFHHPWTISDDQIAAFLDKEYPQLQESTTLVLLPRGELNALQTLAISKVEHILTNLKVKQQPFIKPLLPALGFLLVAVIVLLALRLYTPKQTGFPSRFIPAIFNPPSQPEKVLPQVEEVKVSITPPAYAPAGQV
jgi:hypothetical protein